MAKEIFVNVDALEMRMISIPAYRFTIGRFMMLSAVLEILSAIFMLLSAILGILSAVFSILSAVFSILSAILGTLSAIGILEHRTPPGSFALRESEASATMFYLRESEASATKRPAGTEINPSFCLKSHALFILTQ